MNAQNQTQTNRRSGIVAKEALSEVMEFHFNRAKVLVEIFLTNPLVQEALGRLEKELPRDLKYHSLEHTVDVLNGVALLGLKDGLGERDLTLLGIAAAWHDTGFIIQRANNEPIAVRWVKEAMQRDGGFSESEIEDVSQAIMETQIQFDPETKALYQRCSGRLSPWLLDADLSNLGMRHFMERSVLVHAEMLGKDISSVQDLNDPAGKTYVASTIRLLARHKWHSDAAKELFETQKRLNLCRLGTLFTELHDGTEMAMRQAWAALHPQR